MYSMYSCYSHDDDFHLFQEALPNSSLIPSPQAECSILWTIRLSAL